MKERHHVAIQIEEEQQWQKDNGPIVKTADQLWEYSGQTEEDTEEWKEYIEVQKYANIKAVVGRKCRKDYFKEYWLKNKVNLV